MRRIEIRHRSKLYRVRAPLLDDIESLSGAAHNLDFVTSFSDDSHESESLQDMIENRGENVQSLDVLLACNDTNDGVMLSDSPFTVSTSA